MARVQTAPAHKIPETDSDSESELDSGWGVTMFLVQIEAAGACLAAVESGGVGSGGGVGVGGGVSKHLTFLTLVRPKTKPFLLMKFLCFLSIVIGHSGATNDFCLPSKIEMDYPAPSPISGPPAIGKALQQHLRHCLHVYLPKPQSSTFLELCLFKSSRIIDENNFSIFLGYFKSWVEKDGSVVQDYSGGQTWSCVDNRARSMSLQVMCGKNKDPEILSWKDHGDCSYSAILSLFCL